MCWATISPSSACSEKFFEPTTIVLCSLLHEIRKAADQSSRKADIPRLNLIVLAATAAPAHPAQNQPLAPAALRDSHQPASTGGSPAPAREKKIRPGRQRQQPPQSSQFQSSAP